MFRVYWNCYSVVISPLLVRELVGGLAPRTFTPRGHEAHEQAMRKSPRLSTSMKALLINAYQSAEDGALNTASHCSSCGHQGPREGAQSPHAPHNLLTRAIPVLSL